MYDYMIGIDVALRNTGVVIIKMDPLEVVESKVLRYKTEMSSGTYEESEDFYKSTKEKFVELLPDDRRTVRVVIEGMPRHGHYKSAIKIMIARVNFYRIISELLPKAKVLVPDVFTWKKELMGKANMTKPGTKEFLEEHYMYIPDLTRTLKSVDTMDAAALAIWGLTHGEF